MEECDLAIKAEKAANELVCILKAKSLTLALAESCTCGLISALLAGTPGASAVLWGSFVCYTKEAKISMLGLDADALDAHGLVSEETAGEMASGALEKSGAGFAASVTGLAGPDGDGSSVPVGTVWTAVSVRNVGTFAKGFHFEGSRNSIRLNAAIAVLQTVQDVLNLKNKSGA